MTRLFLAMLLLFATPSWAQMVDGNIPLESLDSMNIDRFGNPTFGLRAQREPELRRLRKQQGRDLFEGEVTVFDLSAEELEALYEKLNK